MNYDTVSEGRDQAFFTRTLLFKMSQLLLDRGNNKLHVQSFECLFRGDTFRVQSETEVGFLSRLQEFLPAQEHS